MNSKKHIFKILNNNLFFFFFLFQARALAPQLGESENVRFLVGTQSLKIADNQVQLVEVNEESHTLVMSYYDHGRGEIWNLTSSPTDSNQFSSVYNTLTGKIHVYNTLFIFNISSAENQIHMQ